MKYLYALLLLLLALIFAAFIQQNGQDVVLRYFQFRTIPLPLSLLMILAFAGGYGLALILGFSAGIRNRVRLASARKECRRLQQELDGLKENGTTGSEGGTPGSQTREAVPAPGVGRGDSGGTGGLASGENDDDYVDAEGRGGKGEL